MEYPEKDYSQQHFKTSDKIGYLGCGLILIIFYPFKTIQEALRKDSSTVAGTLIGAKEDAGYK